MTQHAPYRNFIAGGWMASDEVTRNINPSDTRDVIGEYARATHAQVESAIAAAVAAQPRWAAADIQQRTDAQGRLGQEILQRQAELADLLAREEGKTLPEAAGEAVRATHIFQFYAGEALRPGGELLASARPGMEVEIAREPVGVVSIITPRNFPIAIPAWKIAPALAYGNAVLFKPADLVPASAWTSAEIISRVGLPEGTFNLVMARGRDVSDALMADPRVAAVTFTGSESTGRKVAQTCVGRPGTMARFQLEMGGKNPLVVLDDANLNTAVECAVNGAFYATGQRCTASSRLIVTEGIQDRFVAALVERLPALAVGDTRRPGTRMGLVVDAAQLAQNLDIAIGQQEGARLAFGGQHFAQVDGQPGHYLQPALFVDGTNAMRINREEVFGPWPVSSACATLRSRWPWPTTRRSACPPAWSPPRSDMRKAWRCRICCVCSSAPVAKPLTTTRCCSANNARPIHGRPTHIRRYRTPHHV